MAKVLVAFFSASGVTAKLARSLANVTGGDLFEIRPEVPYTPADLNKYYGNGDTLVVDHYRKLEHHAGDCIQCGQCEGVCPQHLSIIKELKKASAHFDH